VNEWIDELSDLTAAGEAAVLVTISGIRGSSPRETGAKMIVTARETIGTIGGGQLEHQCTHIAAGLLDTNREPATRRFPLGPALGQCCGGVVDVLFEPVGSGLPEWLRDLRALHGQRQPSVLVTDTGSGIKFVVTGDSMFGVEEDACDARIVAEARGYLEGSDAAVKHGTFYEPVRPSDFNIAVFGAGHVGAAVVGLLSGLDCNIRWVDSRNDIFRAVPRNVRTVEAGEPALEVAAMPPGSFYLVMTHSHPLDFDICDRILRRGDAAYCGLIGSLTKRRRFEKRLRQQGLSQRAIEQLVCPIGVTGISGKKPAEIAIAVAAEVLQVHGRAQAQERPLPGTLYPVGS
jgi:xanthine dehydrogenase accessory factor